MSEWKDKSDFEINAAVTSFIHGCEKWDLNDAEFYHCGIDGSGYFSQPILDYCNNPSDAWPIITDSCIIVEPRKNKTALAYTKFDAPHEDENPLRAAMIVYLEMNGVKP